MILSEIKNHLKDLEGVNFRLPNGKYVPENFHVTEVGLVTKHFIDCGGTERMERAANFQLWDAQDYEHRLKPGKLIKIIELSQTKLGLEDMEIEVEFQSDTIGKYGLDFDGKDFLLIPKTTACLASEACGIPSTPLQSPKDDVTSATGSMCTPGGGCC